MIKLTENRLTFDLDRQVDIDAIEDYLESNFVDVWYEIKIIPIVYKNKNELVVFIYDDMMQSYRVIQAIIEAVEYVNKKE